MQVVTETASAAGIASLPTPLIETDADFFVYQPWAFEFTFLDATGINKYTEQYTVDSKAMRKVGPDDDVAVVVEGRTTDGLIFNIEGRMLIQRH